MTMKKILVLFLCLTLTLIAFAGFRFWSTGDVFEEKVAKAEPVAKRNVSGMFFDYLEAKEKYVAELNDEYERRSNDSSATKKAFIKLHTGYIELRGRNTNQIAFKDLYSEAIDFLALDPQDPFSIARAYTIVGGYGPSREQRAEGLERVEQAEGEMEQAGYSSYARVLAMKSRFEYLQASHPSIVHIGRSTEMFNENDSREAVQRLHFAELKYLLDFEDLAAYQGESLFQRIINRFDNKNKGVPHWLKNMIIGHCRVQNAWLARGGGYASSVSREGWDGFERELASAVEHFERAFQLNPNCPEPACQMISVAMANSDLTERSEREWFEQATAAEFDYPEAYGNMLWALRPRWGGSHDAMLEFGRQCMETERYDTRVPYLFIDAVDGVRHDLDEDVEAFKRFKDLYPEISQVCRNYEQAIKEDKENDQTGFASLQFIRALEYAYAYQFDLYEEAFEVYQRYDGDIYSEWTFNRFPKFQYDQTIAITVGNLSDVKELFQSIEQRTAYSESGNNSAEQSEQILFDIEQAQMETEVPEAKSYLNTKRELVGMQLDFHQGDWGDLDFTEDLRHWRKFAGDFNVEGPNSLLATTGLKQSHHLGHYASFPPPYEIELEVECVKAFESAYDVNCGFTCGRQTGPKTGRNFWVNTTYGRMGVGTPNNSDPDGIDVPKETNKIKVNVFDGYYEMYLADKPEHFISVADKKFVPGRIGLGNLYWNPVEAKVRYQNFRIRKLDATPPPPARNYADSAEYYSERLKSFDSYEFRMRLARALALGNRPEESLKALRDCHQKYPENPDAAVALGHTLYTQKKYSACVETHRASLKNYVGNFQGTRHIILNELAWVLAVCPDESVRDGEEAVKFAKQLVDGKKRSDWRYLDTAAVASAENGDFEEAIRYAGLALDRTRKAEERELVREKLELFEQGKPYRAE